MASRGLHSNRYTVVRMVPAGYQTFFQIDGAPRAIGVGVNQGIFMTKGDSIERLTPFIGAYPIRRRAFRGLVRGVDLAAALLSSSTTSSAPGA